MRKEISPFLRVMAFFVIIAIAPRIAGITSRKENLAAVFLSTPLNVAVAIVVPDRDIPGVIASPCTVPIIKASIIPKFFLLLLVLKSYLVNQSIVPVVISIYPAIPGLLKRLSNAFLKENAIMTVGIVPITIRRKRRV